MLSFIIPVYNKEKYLEECLNRLISYNIEDIEVICINDGSSDNSKDILMKFKKNYSNIRVFNIENHGPGYARNLGIKEAKGEFLTFLDADDDINHLTYLDMMLKMKQNDCDIVISDYKQLYDSGKIINHNYKFRNECDYFGLVNNHILVHGKIYKKKFLLENNILFPETYQGEDRVFLGRLVVASPKLSWVDGYGYIYLRHELDENKSLTHCYDKKAFLDRLNNWSLYYNVCRVKYDEQVQYNIIKGMKFLYEMWCKLDNDDKEEILLKLVNFVKEFKYVTDDCLIFHIPFMEFCQLKSYLEYVIKVVEYKLGKENIVKEIIEEPKISIIIPTYNVEKYIDGCICSVLKQTFKDIEVICVDDGSNDSTIELLHEYELVDKRLHLYTQEHKNAGAARNLGIENSRGKYLLFLDGDDFFEHNMLENIYRKIEEDSADICLFDARYYYTNSDTFVDNNIVMKKDYMPKEIPFEGKTFEYIFNLCTASPWNKLIRKDLIQEYNIRFMTLQRCNDIYFIMLCMAVAKKITILNERLVNYRQSDNSLQATNDKSPLNWDDALVELKNKLEQLKIYSYVERSFANYVLSLSTYNLFSMKTSDAFIEVYNEIKNNTYNKYGISMCQKDYFFEYNKLNYEKMKKIQDCSVEQFLFEQLNDEKRKRQLDIQNKNKYIQELENKNKSIQELENKYIQELENKNKCIEELENKYIQELENKNKCIEELENKYIQELENKNKSIQELENKYIQELENKNKRIQELENKYIQELENKNKCIQELENKNKYIQELEAKNEFYIKEIDRINNSYTYKIGNLFTIIPRKVLKYFRDKKNIT